MFKKEFVIVFSFVTAVLVAAVFEFPPIQHLMDWKAGTNTRSVQTLDPHGYEVIDKTNGDEPFIIVDFQKGKHFWHPQLAIWLEDSSGNFLETLVVTTSTGKGLFYASRSARNFKDLDRQKEIMNAPTRRVDALPVWSHKKGGSYPDGRYSPPPNNPMPDGITMPTPSGNFILQARKPVQQLSAFRVMVEINVAFDENEYYSEYDFVDDSLYHNGSGLLGQPSIVYGALIRNTDSTHYYVLSKLGRGHHSGRDGSIDVGMETLTTAHYIVNRLVVGVDEAWYLKSQLNEILN